MSLTASGALAALLEPATTQTEWFNLFRDAMTPCRVVCTHNGSVVRDCAVVGDFEFVTSVAELIGYTEDTTTYAAADLSSGTATFRIENGTYWVEGTAGLAGSGADFIVSANPTIDNGFALNGISINVPADLPYGGSPEFDSVSMFSEDAGVPRGTEQLLVLSLHGSSGSNLTTGRQYRAAVSGLMAYDTYDEFAFSTIRTSDANVMLVRPVDNYDNYPAGFPIRESMWLGFLNAPDGVMRLMTQRRLEALLNWIPENITYTDATKMCLTGGSMGGWGTMTFGVRRPDKFAAIYPDRPRWRYNATIGNVAVPNWTTGLQSVAVASAPQVSDEDGGGAWADLLDCTSYVANTGNKIPWIGWCVGRNDGFVQFSDHVDAVAAMRAAKRGFAFAWNDGNHTTGSIQSEILQSYPYGTFELGKGYPLFTNHSGDQDPAVDITGGINIGLSFRNVVESAGSWSCEVTSVLGARTVDVEPISDVFTTPVAAQTVTIPAANMWVAVSFSA